MVNIEQKERKKERQKERKKERKKEGRKKFYFSKPRDIEKAKYSGPLKTGHTTLKKSYVLGSF